MAIRQDINQANTRIYLIYIVLLIVFIAIIVRLAYLQIFNHEEYLEKANKQQRREIKLAKKRNIITDKNGNELAVDVKFISLYAYPVEYNLKKFSLKEISEKISKVIDKKPEEILKKIDSKIFIWIKRHIPMSKLNELKKLKIPGIGFVYENKRVYTKKKFASSLLGYTGIDNQGLWGVEKSFENLIVDNSEKEQIFLDGIGREVVRKQDGIPLSAAKVKANKVVLSIDENIQYFSEKALEKSVKELRAKRGAAIVMDLSNGDLLSVATYPTFDPNKVLSLSKKEYDDNLKNVKNWIFTDSYEPGSTMKIMTFSAALEAKKTNIWEKIRTPGLIKVEGWARVHDHGASAGTVKYLTVEDVIRTSSNVASSIVGRRIPDKEHYNLLKKFGFGKRTESGFIGEAIGIIPRLKWRESTQSTVSFGQGISVTPIQLISAMTAIGRGGIRIEPRIIREIRSPDNKIIKTFKSRQHRTISEKTANTMLKVMQSVVEKKGGTGVGTKIKGYSISGKTGTADKVEEIIYKGKRKSRYLGNVMASFVGVYPSEKPRIVSLVILDSPKKYHYASLTAVPAFKEITTKVINYLKIPYTKPEDFIEKKNKYSKKDF